LGDPLKVHLTDSKRITFCGAHIYKSTAVTTEDLKKVTCGSCLRLVYLRNVEITPKEGVKNGNEKEIQYPYI